MYRLLDSKRQVIFVVSRPMGKIAAQVEACVVTIRNELPLLTQNAAELF